MPTARSLRLPSLAILGLLLAGCFDSPRTSFYSLTPDTDEASVHSYYGDRLGMGEVALPAELDRRALMVYRSPTRLEIRGTERWAGPLDVLTRDALAVALAARLPRDRMLLPGQARSADDRRTVTVTLHRFAAGPDGRVHLAGRWSLVEGSSVIGSHDVAYAVELGGEDGASIATAMSAAVDRLAEDIAIRLASLPSGSALPEATSTTSSSAGDAGVRPVRSALAAPDRARSVGR